MKVSNGYFKHPITGEMVKPGEMYEEFDKRAVKCVNGGDGKKDTADNAENSTDDIFFKLRGLSIAELKKTARESGVEGVSKMSKSKLIDTMLENASLPELSENIISAMDYSIKNGGDDN